MDDLESIVRLLGVFPATLVLLLVTYLILRSPAGLIIVKKLFSGQTTNGASKRDQAGEASVDYWKNSIREIISEELSGHEKVEDRRYTEVQNTITALVEALRENRREAATGVEKLRERLHALSQSMQQVTASVERSAEAADRAAGAAERRRQPR